MTELTDSWKFLFDFYNYDSSIAGLVNQALGVKSSVTVRSDNSDVLFEDLMSLLPNDIQDKSYANFLAYVTPKYCQKEINDNMVDDIDYEDIHSNERERTAELENVF